MRKLLFILLVSIQAKSQVYFGTAATFHLNLTNLTYNQIGDSYTAGSNASPLSLRFSTLVAANKGAYENNLGQTGRVMQGSACVDTLHKTIIPVYVSGKSGVLIIALGTNDAGQNNGVSTLSAFETKYNIVLDYAITTQGWPVNRIVLFTPYYVTNYSSWVGFGTCGVSVAATESRFLDYVQKVKDIGAARGIRVFDIYNFVKPISGSVLDVDGLHPTNSGHALIAAYIESLL